MTALDITYEDGLRLSELYGQLAGLEYESTHLIAINLAAFILVIVLGMAIAFLPVLCLLSLDDPRLTNFGAEEEARMMSTWAFKPRIIKPVGKKTVTKLCRLTNKFYDVEVDTPLEVRWVYTGAFYVAAILPFIVIPLALCIIMYAFFGASNEMSIAGTQAQIDAILAKYGGMA